MFFINTNFKIKIIILIIISFFVSFLGFKDAISTSSLCNSIDQKNQNKLVVYEKFNKKNKLDLFPNLNLKGEIIQNQDTIEIKVCRGDYENSQIGDTIVIFKVKDEVRYITQYEINNHLMFHIKSKNYSFVFIPAIAFLFIGILAIWYYFKHYV